VAASICRELPTKTGTYGPLPGKELHRERGMGVPELARDYGSSKRAPGSKSYATRVAPICT